MQKIFASIIVISLVFAAALLSQEKIKATTEHGRDVILKPDGTWEYIDTVQKSPVEIKTIMSRPKSSTKLLKMKTGKFGVWFNERKWKQTKSEDISKTLFAHNSGNVYAMVIAERIGMTLDGLRELAITNAQNAAPDADVIFEETRIVNGKEILCLKIAGSIQRVQFTYYGYYYAGKAGTLQLITYTGSNLFDEYQKDMTDFLNGLEIYDTD